MAYTLEQWAALNGGASPTMLGNIVTPEGSLVPKMLQPYDLRNRQPSIVNNLIQAPGDVSRTNPITAGGENGQFSDTGGVQMGQMNQLNSPSHVTNTPSSVNWGKVNTTIDNIQSLASKVPGIAQTTAIPSALIDLAQFAFNRPQAPAFNQAQALADINTNYGGTEAQGDVGTTADESSSTTFGGGISGGMFAGYGSDVDAMENDAQGNYGGSIGGGGNSSGDAGAGGGDGSDNDSGAGGGSGSAGDGSGGTGANGGEDGGASDGNDW